MKAFADLCAALDGPHPTDPGEIVPDHPSTCDSSSDPMPHTVGDGNRDAISIDSNPLLRIPSKLIASWFPTHPGFHPTATRSLASEE